MSGTITEKQYRAFQVAFEHFNARLFDGALPDVVITLNRKRGAGGYFGAERFVGSESGQIFHEIALNPDCFNGDATPQWILSILVHEQAHLWQQEHGKKKCRKAYHNREWADKMEEIGLMPSTTSAEGGARTGQRCGHYIIEGGPFEWACEDLLMCHDALLFTSVIYPKTSAEAKKNKILYECQGCGQKAWAKPEAKLMCGECREDMEPEDE